jgi:hypothetical protein
MKGDADQNRAERGLVHPGSPGDVLVLSMRSVADLVAYCAYYEFEDLIVDLTGADRFDVGDGRSLEFSRRIFKLVRYSTGSPRLAWACAPKATAAELERRYELFLPVFTHPHELFALASIPDWRKRCRLAACYIVEMWQHELPKYLLELLCEFDHIFLGVQHPIDEVARITGRPCSYLPLAADVMRFAPYPQFPERVIDICNIGRRSSVTHEAVIAHAADAKLFYYYDTIAASGSDHMQRTFHVQNPAEHRLLLANLLKRTRYYVANRARANDPRFTRGHQEVSGRFYEGAASGTVMLGETPDSEAFRRQFDWEDAIVPMPFDSPDVGKILADLDNDPQRIAAIRENNLRNAALRHDWTHRLRTIYEKMGLPPTDAMIARERRLESMAAAVTSDRLNVARGVALALFFIVLSHTSLIWGVLSASHMSRAIWQDQSRLADDRHREPRGVGRYALSPIGGQQRFALLLSVRNQSTVRLSPSSSPITGGFL